jgi:hypothetical protein
MAGHSLFSSALSQLTRIIPTQATSQALARPQAIRDATFFRFESLRFHSESAHRMAEAAQSRFAHILRFRSLARSVHFHQ